MCTRFVIHLFDCPDIPPTSCTGPVLPPPTLEYFIAYALYRTRLPNVVTFSALYLLLRLKMRYPDAHAPSEHRLFLTSFMISSKFLCDDTYTDQAWLVVGQGMFELQGLNAMERDMCQKLDWKLNIYPEVLRGFERDFRADFKGDGPYPHYIILDQRPVSPSIDESPNAPPHSYDGPSHPGPPPTMPYSTMATHAHSSNTGPATEASATYLPQAQPLHGTQPIPVPKDSGMYGMYITSFMSDAPDMPNVSPVPTSTAHLRCRHHLGRCSQPSTRAISQRRL